VCVCVCVCVYVRVCVKSQLCNITTYGVHHNDKKSHTGSAFVVGDLCAVYCRSAKQQIVTKNSSEAEL
jgi:hypothetical protein